MPKEDSGTSGRQMESIQAEPPIFLCRTMYTHEPIWDPSSKPPCKPASPIMAYDGKFGTV